MAVEYINRRGDTYYLHEGKTRTGKPKYFFSMKKDGVLVDSIPAEYEIYENPNAQVFLRKVPPQIFTDEEIALVENGITKHVKLIDFKIDIKGNKISVFLPNQDIDSLKQTFAAFGQRSDYKLNQFLKRILTYSPMMRFVLNDERKRVFQVERMCFLGSIDDWIFLDESDNLAQLVRKYGKHLGKESFFDLS